MMKGVLRLKGFAKFLYAALLLVFFAGAASAAQGDEPVSLTDERGAPLGNGFYRAGALWVPYDSLKAIGMQVSDGPGGKGYIINVPEPDVVFGEDVAMLAGGPFTLYFPELIVNKVSYFNITGLEPVTRIHPVGSGSSVVLTRLQSAPLTQRTSRPALPAGKLSLAWIYVTSDNPDIGADRKLRGLDVVSPTWFNLMDGMGGLANRASTAYVDAAHKKGYQVWALVSNGFSKANTTALFQNKSAMRLFIARIVAYSMLYGLDGINIDFEAFSSSDRDSFTNFMSALSPVMKAHNLAFSFDAHIPANTNTSRMHDRGSLAKYVDYVMLMAYDEHWRTCKTPGSVASLPWVESAVEKTIAEGVPPEKLVLGVPFYMRRWEESQEAGKTQVKSMTLSMASSDALIQSRGLAPQWRDDVGQYYYAYADNGKTYKVWAEDGQSLAKKLALIDKYRLAGMAGWRHGQEKPEVWNVIASALGK